MSFKSTDVPYLGILKGLVKGMPKDNLSEKQLLIKQRYEEIHDRAIISLGKELGSTAFEMNNNSSDKSSLQEVYNQIHDQMVEISRDVKTSMFATSPLNGSNTR